MSTLASRVRALERHRRAVARELAAAGCCRFVASGHLCMLDEFAVRCLLHEDGAVAFDVHAAREHAKGLVALAGEQAVFEDWTRGRGLGPENREPGAFHDGSLRLSENDRRALARCGVDHRARGGWPGKLAREWPGDSRAPMGRSLARMGQRILDALEGQASECQGLSGRCKGGHHEHWGSMDPPCPDCHGTGHNLRGKLPGVEWSPAVRRKAGEAVAGPVDRTPERWLDATFTAHCATGGTLTRWDHERGEIVRDARTRVCPRGEHRTAEDPNERAWGFTGLRAELDHNGYKRGEHVRVHGYGKGRWRPRTTHDKPEHACTPGWRRGEIEHARQRREREAKRGEVVVEGGTDEAVSVAVRTSFTV